MLQGIPPARTFMAHGRNEWQNKHGPGNEFIGGVIKTGYLLRLQHAGSSSSIHFSSYKKGIFYCCRYWVISALFILEIRNI